MKLNLSSSMPASYMLPKEIFADDPWDSKTTTFDSPASRDRFNRHAAGREERALINANNSDRKRAREASQDKVSHARQSSSRDSPAASQSFGTGRADPRINIASRGSVAGNSPPLMYSPASPASNHRRLATPSSAGFHHR
jgi:hypothetical protein